MDNDGDNYFSLQNSELFNIWLTKEKRGGEKGALLNYVINKSGFEDKQSDLKHQLSKKLSIFCINLAEKWTKCHRNLNFFQTKFSDWLKSETVFNINIDTSMSTPEGECPMNVSSHGTGRPQLPYSEKSERSKRRQAADLSISQSNETDLLVRAAAISARKEGQVDLAVVLKETIESPSRPSKNRKKCTQEVKTVTTMTAEEALAFLLENNFSKRQYCSIRNECVQRFPAYNHILDYKRKCRPSGIVLSEKCARVPLKMLLIHTASRIVETQCEVIQAVMTSTQSNKLSAELILSYGFDSSSGQAQYKQRYSDSTTSRNADACLLATTVTPLRLLTSSGKPLWNNRFPQSTRFCRPLKLEFTNETKEIIIKEADSLNKEIESIENLEIEIGEGKKIEISFSLSLTVIDGKVLNVLTETTSTQKCPICHATPKDFIAVNDCTSEKFRPIEGNLIYGISPLHCWIRLFEFVLHLGYKIDIKKWQIRSDEDKKAVLEKKATIQKEFWKELGLRVDVPKAGGSGSTNDGNTSRRAFAEHEIFSAITQVDQDLIFRLKVILICISCQFALDLQKFEKYCFETAEYYISKYPWLPMTPTLHKVLIHSKQIMENTALPVGYFGEEAAEARNKIYKRDRLHHARRTSRIDNISDVFTRALDTSDPLISSVRLSTRAHQRKRLVLPPEVIGLLCCEHIADTLDTEETSDKSNASDDEYDENEENGYESEYLVLENELNINGSEI